MSPIYRWHKFLALSLKATDSEDRKFLNCDFRLSYLQPEAKEDCFIFMEFAEIKKKL